MIYSRLCSFWNPQGDFSLMELGNGFYLFKCDEEEVIERGPFGRPLDYSRKLLGSPAMETGHLSL